MDGFFAILALTIIAVGLITVIFGLTQFINSLAPPEATYRPDERPKLTTSGAKIG